MRVGGIASAIFGIFVSISAGADSLESGPSLDPLAVKCVLRERKFFTEILFSVNSQEKLTGEMCHYVNVGEHGRRFMNGSIFFDIISDEERIEGFTGDPRGMAHPFVLYPVNPKQLNGKWRYIQTDPSGHRTQALFRCTYGGN